MGRAQRVCLAYQVAFFATVYIQSNLNPRCMGSACRNNDHPCEDSQQLLHCKRKVTESNMQAHESSPILTQRLSYRAQPLNTFSWPGVVIGLLIGTIYCNTNIYFGLRTGQISGAPIAAAFFTILISKHLQLGLNPAEIMFAVTLSTAVAIMSLAGGFVGPIPALTQLLGPEEHAGGAVKFSWLQLAIFAAALSGSGPIFALLMRGQFSGLSARYELPFPSAAATAKIILAYAGSDGDSRITPRLAPEHQSEDSNLLDDAQTNQSTLDSLTDTRNWCAMGGILASLVYSLAKQAALIFPPRYGPDAPFLIRIAATYSKWIDLSPGLVGQGFIIGPQIAYETFTGAMFGELVLPWILYLKYWALEDLDADRGADVVRIWALWLGLVVMLVDCSFEILWTLPEALRGLWQKMDSLARQRNQALIDASRRAEAMPTVGLDSNIVRIIGTVSAAPNKKSSPRFSKLVLALALVTLAPLCVLALQQTVGSFVPWIETLVAICLALPLSYVSILATGRADYTPANALGLFSQIMVGWIDSSSIQYAVIVNIALGAVVESAACQAATMMSKLKAGEAVGANPDTLFWGQLSGSLVGALVASLFFRYLMGRKTAQEGPRTKFNMPGAHMFLVTAKLALNSGLPKHAMWGAALIGIIFGIIAALKIRFADRAWVKWIPSGTAFATGMYNFPAVTIDWLIGSLIGDYWGKRGDETAITLFGSGLMVGEGLSQLILGWFL